MISGDKIVEQLKQLPIKRIVAKDGKIISKEGY